MNHRKILLATVVAALLLNGCSRGDKNTIQIALVLKALDSEFWHRVQAGGEEAARANPGVKLSVLAPEREINIDQQVSILEDQILKRVSAIAVAPAGVSEIVPALNGANAAKIPVVIVDTDLNWPPKLSYIGTNNRLGGRLAGEFIRKTLGGKGKVAVIRGVLGVSTHDERLAGFREAIAETPGIELVTVQPANSERALGMTVMENLLTSHPDITAVFATNDQMALGAAEALAARGKTGKIAVVGFDATKEAVRAVESGRLSAVVAQHPEMMGRRAVEQAIKAARGEVIDKVVDTGTSLVTKENANQFLK